MKFPALVILPFRHTLLIHNNAKRSLLFFDIILVSRSFFLHLLSTTHNLSLFPFRYLLLLETWDVAVFPFHLFNFLRTDFHNKQRQQQKRGFNIQILNRNDKAYTRSCRICWIKCLDAKDSLQMSRDEPLKVLSEWGPEPKYTKNISYVSISADTTLTSKLYLQIYQNDVNLFLTLILN